MIEQEVWKDVDGYDGCYSISTIGEVLSRKRSIKTLLKASRCRQGYARVYLSKYGISKSHALHRLVAQTFIENPESKSQVNHKNGIKHDNRVGNLEWSTPSENSRHAYDTGLSSGCRGSKNGRSKLSEKDVVEIKKMLLDGLLNKKEIGEIYSIDKSQIHLISAGKSWKHVKLYE